MVRSLLAISKFAISPWVLFFCSFLLSTNLYAEDLSKTATDLKNFDYASITDFGKIGGVVADQLGGEVSSKVGGKIDGAISPYVVTNTIGGALLPKVVSQVVTDRDAVKKALKENLHDDLQAATKNYLDGHLMSDKSPGSEMGVRISGMIDSIISESMDNIDNVVDRAADKSAAWGGYFRDTLSATLAEEVGKSTAVHLKKFADEQAIEKLGLGGEGIDLATIDVAAEVDKRMEEAGEAIEANLNKMKGVDLSDVEKGIDGVLKESGLPNPYGLSAKDYLSAGSGSFGLSSLGLHTTDMVRMAGFGFDSPIDFELPSGIYAVVQIAASVTHLMRSIGFLFINFDEIRRAGNCLNTANWVLTDKNRAFKVIGGRFGSEGSLPRMGSDGIGFDSAGISEKLTSITEDLKTLSLEKIETASAEALARTKIKSSIEELGKIKTELDGAIVAAKSEAEKLATSLDDEIKEGFKAVKEEANEKLASIADLTGVGGSEANTLLANAEAVKEEVEKKVAEVNKKISRDGEWGGQCVRYVRDYFCTTSSDAETPGLCATKDGKKDCGAYQAWSKWDFDEGKGSIPKPESIMVFNKGTGNLKDGHVAVVTAVSKNENGTYRLTVNESNWGERNSATGKWDLNEKIDEGVIYIYDSKTRKVTSRQDKHDEKARSLGYSISGFVYAKTHCSESAELPAFKATSLNGVTGSELETVQEEKTVSSVKALTGITGSEVEAGQFDYSLESLPTYQYVRNYNPMVAASSAAMTGISRFPRTNPGLSPSSFHHYGNWGGPGYAAGGYVKETELTLEDFNFPVKDARDACYRDHDKCIWEKHDIKECDHKAASCLRAYISSISNEKKFDNGFALTEITALEKEAKGFLGTLPAEAASFDTWIPNKVH